MKVMMSGWWMILFAMMVCTAAGCKDDADEDDGDDTSDDGDGGDDTGVQETDDTGSGDGNGDSEGGDYAEGCEDVADGAGECMSFYGLGEGRTPSESTCLIRQCIACEDDNGVRGMCDFTCPDTCEDLYAEYLDCLFGMDCSGGNETQQVDEEATACEQTLSEACGY